MAKNKKKQYEDKDYNREQHSLKREKIEYKKYKEQLNLDELEDEYDDW